jgi:adenylosuccinate synthase
MHTVVVITGHKCTGKSQLGNNLKRRFDLELLKTSKLVSDIAEKRSLQTDRSGLQMLGDQLDAEKGDDWVFKECQSRLALMQPNSQLVVDCVRTWKQLEYFRACRDIRLKHVHLYASADELLKRFSNKHGLNSNYEKSNIIKIEDDITLFKNDADVRINTDFTDSEDTLVRVAANLGLYSPPEFRCVDVIIGGQYGSEGKGHVTAYLSSEYDVLIRVGGPNAGHTVSGLHDIYTYHQLPSGTRDCDAEILLGPGMTIYVPKLLEEISDCKIGSDRLYIDPQAIVITDEDKLGEGGLKGDISSTGSGSGSAAARRIMGRGKQETLLAKDIPELREYVGTGPRYRGRTIDRLERAYRKGQNILLEGTQGSGLSVFHGPYPYVTSRDTNVAGCLAEAGISPSRVRRILMVIRPTPIRVANPIPKKMTPFRAMLVKFRMINQSATKTSGPLKHETNFDAVANKGGLEGEEVTKNEITSTTKRNRRVGWFEWDQFRDACSINAPTDIVLTFSDYLNKKNREARRFEQLDIDTIKFVEEIERVSHVAVSLIATRFPRTEVERFDLRSIIDRRNWTTRKAQEERLSVNRDPTPPPS